MITMVHWDMKHLLDLVVPSLMILGLWIDYRVRSSRQHTQTQTRLTALETKVDPVWNWFTDKLTRNAGD